MSALMRDSGMLHGVFAVHHWVRVRKSLLGVVSWCLDVLVPSGRCELSNTPHVSNLSHLRVLLIEGREPCAAE